MWPQKQTSYLGVLLRDLDSSWAASVAHEVGAPLMVGSRSTNLRVGPVWGFHPSAPMPRAMRGMGRDLSMLGGWRRSTDVTECPDVSHRHCFQHSRPDSEGDRAGYAIGPCSRILCPPSTQLGVSEPPCRCGVLSGLPAVLLTLDRSGAVLGLLGL